MENSHPALPATRGVQLPLIIPPRPAVAQAETQGAVCTKQWVVDLLLGLAGSGGRYYSGVMEWSGHYVVDPWTCSGLVNLDEYPRLGSYFAEHSEALKKRHTVAGNIRGWYKTIDRVTHSLTSIPKHSASSSRGKPVGSPYIRP